jgi:hypothetical protein
MNQRYYDNKLSREHIKYVLGIEISLNESYVLTESNVKAILEAQLLYETFLDTIKDFAKEKYNQVVNTIKDWKDAAVVLGKVLSNDTTLQNFSDNYWKSFKANTLKQLNNVLDKLGLSSVKQKIIAVIDKITSLKGWKKFLAATAIGSIVKYITNNVSKLPKEELENYIEKYLSDKGLSDVLGKLTDIKSYFGWLSPIIKTVEIFYDSIKPTLDKFKKNLFPNMSESNHKEQLHEGEFCPACLIDYILEHRNILAEAKYQGRTVQLGKPMAGDVKKFKVYVKNNKGNVVKVNFGQKGVKIKKNNPVRRKSFRARHGCDTNPGPRWKARYWSCRKW